MPYNGKYIPEKDDFYKLSRSKKRNLFITVIREK